MINKATIENTYKKFNKRPASPDELNLGVLFGDVFENHGLKLDEKYLTINSVDPASPFHRIPLRNICEIVEFADHVAVVLPASMIIMRKDSPDVFINIKTRPASLEERLPECSILQSSWPECSDSNPPAPARKPRGSIRRLRKAPFLCPVPTVAELRFYTISRP